MTNQRGKGFYKIEMQRESLEAREKRVAYRLYEADRKVYKARLFMVVTVVSLILGGAYFTYKWDTPTGDEGYYTKYCRLVNKYSIQRGEDTAKVWSCPGVRWEGN